MSFRFLLLIEVRTVSIIKELRYVVAGSAVSSALLDRLYLST